MTVAELSGRLTSAEEAHWIALHQKEPLFMGPRMDAGLAQIAQIQYNLNAKKEHRKKLTDFMLFYRKPVKVDKDINQNVRNFFSKFKKDK